MLIKAFNRGKGAGYGPVEYAIALNPFGRGSRGTAPKILKGDPKMMRMQIDAVPFAWKYTSGVISFSKEDFPTEWQLDEVMNNFEELAFAGLPLSSRSILWVLHRHLGRLELHFIIPRQEVHSGKSFNALGEVLNRQHWNLLLQNAENNRWQFEKTTPHIPSLLHRITTQAENLANIYTLHATLLTIQKQHKKEAKRLQAQQRLQYKQFTSWVIEFFREELSLQQLKERCEEYPMLEKEFTRFCQHLTDRAIAPHVEGTQPEEGQQAGSIDDAELANSPTASRSYLDTAHYYADN